MKKVTRQGLSLPEVVIASMLAGVVVVGALDATSSILSSWSHARHLHRGQALAQQLMSEILQQHYEEPVQALNYGRELNESSALRELWDDIDDYHGWTKSPPVDKSGQPISGYDGWSRSVIVELVQMDNPTQVSMSDSGLKRIEVTTYDPDGARSEVIAYRSRWGAMETPPAASFSVQGYLSHQLQFDGTMINGGVQLKNHATDE